MQSKLFPAGLGVVLAAGLVSWSSPSAWSAEVIPETYGFSDARAHDVSDIHPVRSGSSFSDSASAVSNPLNRMLADASASASAFGESFGPFGAKVSIAGNADNPDAAGRNDVVATASSANYVQYLVTSDVLAAGAAVRGRLTLNFKGGIEITDGNPAVPDESGLYAYVFADTQLGQNDGQMDIVHEGGADFDPDDQSEWGDFDGHGVFTHDATAGRHAATFDFTDAVEFDTTVGSTVELSFNLWLDAKADLPLNVSAVVDFSPGSSYSLAAADPSQARFAAVVPEPAALSLAALAAGTTLLRRRRR